MSERTWDGHADVIVIGMGAAGFSAAIEAHDAGSEVLILEKMPAEHAGGNTRVSGNVWFNPTDPDLAETYFHGLAAEFPAAPEIAHAWAQETSRNTEWIEARLREVGNEVERDPRDPYHGPPTADLTPFAVSQRSRTGEDIAESAYELADLPGHECDDGYHHLKPTQGLSRLWYALKAAVEARDISILYSTSAKRLIKDSDGAVIGVEAEDGSALALEARRGVVLATGGFANNQQMARDFLRLPHAATWGSPGNTGDGIKMAQLAGADLTHMNNFAGVPGVKVAEHETAMSGVPKGPSFIMVGDDGRRFVNESIQDRHGKARLTGPYQLYPAAAMHTIFDERARQAGAIVVSFERHQSGWAKVMRGIEWSADNLAEIGRGWIKSAETPAALAAELGVDPEALEATIVEYNEFCAEGRDRRFDRPKGDLQPIVGPPYYAFTWGQVILYTNGGPRKDSSARVIDAAGDPIPRLYCAGEVSSSYPWTMGGGQMIGDALAFGRIAGRGAAAQAARGAAVAASTLS